MGLFVLNRWQKFWGLPPAARRLFMAAAFLIFGLWIALRFLPFSFVRRVVERATDAPSPSLSNETTTQPVAWAIRAAGRFLPFATCLPRALSGYLLLHRKGCPADLKIGVTRDPDGQFLAHAWVESGGGVVIGTLPDLARYTPLQGESNRIVS